jgi:hypothetical protein
MIAENVKFFVLECFIKAITKSYKTANMGLAKGKFNFKNIKL